MSRDQVDSARPDRSVFSTSLSAAIAGMLVFGLIDVLWGMKFNQATFGSAAFVGVSVAIALSSCALVGLFLGLLGSAVYGFGGRRKLFGKSWLSAAFIVSFAVLAWAFIRINTETFAGPRAQSMKNRDLIVAAFHVGGIVGIGVALSLAGFLVSRAKRSVSYAALTIVIGLGFSLAAQMANHRTLVGLYPMLHTQLAAAAAFGALVAAAAAAVRAPRLKLWLGLALVLVLAGFAVRRLPQYRRSVGLATQKTQGIREFALPASKIFGIVPSIAAPDVTVDVAIAAEDTAAAAEAQTALDKLLPDRRQMNVLFLAVDTLRADHCSFNGYNRKTTPNLDKLAADSFVFSRAYAPYPTSNYSYCSTLTSLAPRSTSIFGFITKKSWQFQDDVTLPGFLGKRGWNSIGISAFNRANVRDPAFFGFLGDGFRVYNPDQKEEAAHAPDITQSALETFAEETKRPFFSWVHYIDPHSPYELWEKHNFGDSIIDAYDSDIAYTDEFVGKFLDGMRERGDLERTIVVVFSDHGEEFDEHGGRFHNTKVYEEQIHVPLIIRVPGLKGRTIDTPVSLLDLLPTTLGLLGQKDTQKRQGRNLLPLLLDPNRKENPVVYSEWFRIQGARIVETLRTVIVDKKKIIRRLPHDQTELFDLAADPRERNNLVGTDDRFEAEMNAYLAAWDRKIESHHEDGGSPTTQAKDPADELKERLDHQLGRLAQKDDKVSADAQTLIMRQLWDYLGEPLPDAVYVLGDAGLDQLTEKLEKLYATDISDSAKTRVLKIIAEANRPRSIPFWDARLGELNTGSVVAAQALARLGNDRGRDILRKSLESPLAPDDRDIAIALARLGDPAAHPWIAPTLMPTLNAQQPWRSVGQMIDALPTSGIKDPAYLIRDFVTERAWRPKPVMALLARSLGRMAADPEARWMLLRLTSDSDPLVREAAQIAAERAGVGKEELAKASEPLAAELDGEEAVVNSNWNLMAVRWRDAIAKSPIYNAGLRLRFARYLQHSGAEDEAKKILTDVAANAPNPIDKKIAERRLAMVAAPARIIDPATFGIEVTDFRIPAKVSPNLAFLADVTVKNTGKVPWQGGYWRHWCGLSIRWLDEAGRPLEQKIVPATVLSAEGLMPGESTTMSIIGLPPTDVRDYESRGVLIFSQPWLNLPQDGIVAKADKPTWIGAGKQDKSATTRPVARSTGKVTETSRAPLAEGARAGVSCPEPVIWRTESDGRPVLSTAGFVALANEGKHFYYGALVGDRRGHAESIGAIGVQNWGDVEAMSLAARIVAEWGRRHPDGPRLGIDEISGPHGGFPDFDKDGLSDHRTHQTGQNINFLLPCKVRPERYIHMDVANQELYDPVLYRELIDLLVDVGAYSMTTNTKLRVQDLSPDLPPQKHKWRELQKSLDGTIKYATDMPRTSLYLLQGPGDHGDHVNTLLWNDEK